GWLSPAPCCSGWDTPARLRNAAIGWRATPRCARRSAPPAGARRFVCSGGSGSPTRSFRSTNRLPDGTMLVNVLHLHSGNLYGGVETFLLSLAGLRLLATAMGMSSDF